VSCYNLHVDVEPLDGCDEPSDRQVEDSLSKALWHLHLNDVEATFRVTEVRVTA